MRAPAREVNIERKLDPEATGSLCRTFPRPQRVAIVGL